MFQEFDDAQIADLTAFIETSEYLDLKKLPPWQRAYGVARHLRLEGSEASFNTMLNAFWFETGSFLQSSEAMNSFLFEAKLQIARAPDSDKPFLKAILGYALAVSGRIDEAKPFVQGAKQTPDIPEFLQAYIISIEACLANMDSEECQPDTQLKRN